MATTVLGLVQQAAGEMGLAVPAVLTGNAPADSSQLLYLANALGQELSRRHAWQALTKQYLFTVSATSITANTSAGSSSLTNASSIAGIDATFGIAGPGINQATYVSGTPSGSTIPLSQPASSTNTGATYTLAKVRYAMPADYDRIIDDTQWDKSKHWRMLGPETAQQWEWLISGYISTGPRMRFRIFSNYFQIWPLPGSAQVLGFEYVSNAWATGAAGTGQSAFLVENDTCVFPDRLMVLGLKKKYFEVKGFDTSLVARDFAEELDLARAHDAGSPVLSLAPRAASVLIGYENIPDSGYGA